jgi:hypothetical protein
MARKMKKSRSSDPPVPDGQATVFCKLFSDCISGHLCGLRRRELDRKGGFLCEGCPIDAVIHRLPRPDATTPVVTGIGPQENP